MKYKVYEWQTDGYGTYWSILLATFETLEEAQAFAEDKSFCRISFE